MTVSLYELDDVRRVDPDNVMEYATMLAARIDTAYMLRWLGTADTAERELLQRMAEGIIKQREIIQHNLAVDITNEVARLFK